MYLYLLIIVFIYFFANIDLYFNTVIEFPLCFCFTDMQNMERVLLTVIQGAVDFPDPVVIKFILTLDLPHKIFMFRNYC